MGHSGAGKSTLCLALNVLVPNLKKGVFKGEVKIKGTPTVGHKVSHFARTVVLVFQDFETQLFFTSVELEVAFGPENFNVCLTLERNGVARISPRQYHRWIIDVPKTF